MSHCSKVDQNADLFLGLIDKISKRIEGWQAKLLSVGGNLTLVKSVLNSIPIHQLSILQAPNKVLDLIQQKIQNFVWDNSVERRHQWIKGAKMRCSYGEGGLQVDDLYTVMQGLH